MCLFSFSGSVSPFLARLALAFGSAFNLMNGSFSFNFHVSRCARTRWIAVSPAHHNSICRSNSIIFYLYGKIFRNSDKLIRILNSKSNKTDNGEIERRLRSSILRIVNLIKICTHESSAPQTRSGGTERGY